MGGGWAPGVPVVGTRAARALADTGARISQARSPSGATALDDVRPLPKQRLRHWWPHRHRVLVADRVQLSPTAREFLLASIRRDRYRRGRSTTILSVLLILSLAAAGIAVGQQRVAEERQRLATTRQLVTQAETARGSDQGTALLLGLAAQDIYPGPEALSSLVNTLITTRFANTLADHTSIVRSVAFAPDGRILATPSADATTLLWDLNDLNDVREHATEHACSITGRGLDRDEWDRNIRGLEYVDTCAT